MVSMGVRRMAGWGGVAQEKEERIRGDSKSVGLSN